jgi:hypothetical protein
MPVRVTAILAAVVTLQAEIRMARFLAREKGTLEVRASDPKSAAQQWTVVLVEASELRENATAPEFFAPGRGYVITGHPAVDPQAHRLLAVSVTRPDGAVWSR